MTNTKPHPSRPTRQRTTSRLFVRRTVATTGTLALAEQVLLDDIDVKMTYETISAAYERLEGPAESGCYTVRLTVRTQGRVTLVSATVNCGGCFATAQGRFEPNSRHVEVTNVLGNCR